MNKFYGFPEDAEEYEVTIFHAVTGEKLDKRREMVRGDYVTVGGKRMFVAYIRGAWGHSRPMPKQDVFVRDVDENGDLLPLSEAEQERYLKGLRLEW